MCDKLGLACRNAIERVEADRERRLIEAAPKLLAVLKKIADDPFSTAIAGDMAREAIRLAEPESELTPSQIALRKLTAAQHNAYPKGRWTE